MKIPRDFKLPNERYMITENDIVDIIIAFNNQDYDWILYFFETLVPIQREPSYTFEELLKNTGITFHGK